MSKSNIKNFSDKLKKKKQKLLINGLSNSFVQNFQGIIFQSDMEFKALIFKGAVKKITGYTPRDFLSGNIKWDQLIHADDIERFYRDGDDVRKIPHTNNERDYRIVRKDGRIVWVHESLHNVCNALGKPIWIEGIFYDVTNSKLVEKRLAAQYEIVKVLSDHNPHTETLTRILKVSGEVLDWDISALWMVDQDIKKLKCIKIWHKSPDKTSLFGEASEKMGFEKGEGLPGKVWASKKPVWIPNVTIHNNFPRARIARKEGIVSAFAFPIRAHHKTLGVIEFFSFDTRSPDKDVMEIGEVLGHQIGHFMEHEKVENEREVLFNKLKKESEQTKELASALEKERDILDITMENTHAQLAYLDSDFNFIKVNSSYVLSSGYRHDELIGKNHFDLFPHEENQKIFEGVKKTGKGVTYFRKPFEYINQPKRGITYWDWTLNPVKDEGGKVIGLVLSLLDVTDDVRSDKERERLLEQVERERERVQQGAIEAEERASELDAVFMALVDAVLVYDIKGLVAGANFSAMRMFGFNPIGKGQEELAGMVNVRHRRGEVLKIEEMLSTQALKGNVIPSKHIIIRNTAGKDIMVVASASPIRRRGKVMGAVVILHDVSESWQVEKQKDTFIATASHELKTPVTTIKAFVQIFQKRLEESYSMQGNIAERNNANLYLSKVDTQLDKLTGLINELLDVTKMEAGKLELHKEIVDIDKLLDEAVEDFQHICQKHRVIKKGKVGDTIIADRDRLTQVLVNLFSNAVKYSPQADKIIVSACKNENYITVSVKDFGIGVSRQDHAKIFDRFYRVNGPNKERFSGLGLGLYISSEIIAKHGGRMGVRSKLGQGSTFFFTLPFEKKNS